MNEMRIRMICGVQIFVMMTLTWSSHFSQIYTDSWMERDRQTDQRTDGHSCSSYVLTYHTLCVLYDTTQSTDFVDKYLNSLHRLQLVRIDVKYGMVWSEEKKIIRNKKGCLIVKIAENKYTI